MPIVPSVAMKGSMRPTVVIRPLARPQSAPMPIASSMAATSIRNGLAIMPLFKNMIVRLATKATIEPTERSRPPAEMTKVAPTAMIAMKALRVSTLERLSMPRKFGLTKLPSTSSSASATKGATARRSTSRQDRRGGAALVISVMPVPPSRRPPSMSHPSPERRSRLRSCVRRSPRRRCARCA